MCKRISNMKVYISGKIGEEVISEATRQKFEKAQKMLLSKGYEVMNPACEEYQAEMNKEVDIEEKKWADEGYGEMFDRYAHILLWDLRVINICDAVYFLEDWDRSDGANTEHSFAMATGKKLLWESRMDAEVFCDYDKEKPEDIWLPIDGKEGGV